VASAELTRADPAVRLAERAQKLEVVRKGGGTARLHAAESTCERNSQKPGGNPGVPSTARSLVAVPPRPVHGNPAHGQEVQRPSHIPLRLPRLHKEPTRQRTVRTALVREISRRG
jgi:hypothetical protein